MTLLIWRRRALTAVPGLIVLALVAAIIGMLALEAWTPGPELSGTVVALAQRSSSPPAANAATLFLVELDGGGRVVALGTEGLPFEPSRRVLVRKESSGVSHRHRHRFVAYIDAAGER